jgi:hypothetical protein
MRVWLACFGVVAGCAGDPTTLLVRVTDGDPGPAPDSIVVQVFDAHGRIAAASLLSVRLPGSLVVRGLPDVDQELRVVVGAPGGVIGGARVQARARAQVSVDVTLGSGVSDGDGDGVPDELDDCPGLADPLQDAVDCGGSPVDEGMPADLAPAVDLAQPPDLTGIDFAVAPSLCASAGVAFCDGFEAATLDSHWNGNNQQGAASYARDTSRAYRGVGSLKLHYDAVAANAIASAAVGETQTFPMSDFFVRAFFYQPSPAPTQNQALLFAIQSVSPYSQLSIEVDSSDELITYNNIMSPSLYQQSTTTLPTDRWVCVEWEVVATASGTTHVWIDGTEVTALHATQNLLASPPISLLQFGVSVYKPAVAVPAHDLWFDEVVVDGARVGCTK